MVERIGETAWARLAAKAMPLGADRLARLSPLLIIAPHADDETLGCGGLIAEASDRGLAVRVVFLTDGAASHLGSPTWPPTRLADMRRDEALSAIDILGLNETDVLFLNWPDSNPYAFGSGPFVKTVNAVARWLAAEPPRSLWAPFRGEQHCDHRSARSLALELRHRWAGATLHEYLVWGWGDDNLCDTHGARAIWRLDCAHNIDRRRRALASHASQLGGVIMDAKQAFQIPENLAALVDRPSEIFLEVAA